MAEAQARIQVEAAAGNPVQFLTFTIGEEEYGVDIMMVREVKGWTETTRLPNTPEFMRGVLNLRGVIVPIFDLRARFGLGLTNANDKNVVIILALEARIVGILVDTVSDILTINTGEIKPPPADQDGVADKMVSGLISVDERMVVLLDVARLLTGTATGDYQLPPVPPSSPADLIQSHSA